MDGYAALVSICLSLVLMKPPSLLAAPTSHHGERHGVLRSIAHCNDDQQQNIFHNLVNTFENRVPSLDLTIPPTTVQSTYVFLTVTTNVFNSKIASIAIENSELTSEDGIPAWRIRKASVVSNGEYSYSSVGSSDSGTYTLKTDQIKMYLIDHKCQIDLGDISKVFSGAAANWGYNTFFKGSKEDDEKYLKEKICHVVRRIFHDVLIKSSCKDKVAPETAATTHSFEDFTEDVDVVATRRPRPRLVTKPREATAAPKYREEEYAINDEPLVIPGFLPYVDPEEEKSNSATSISKSSTLYSTAFVLFFVWLTFSLL